MDKSFINSRFLEVINLLISSKIAKNKAEISSNLGISASKFSEILNERMLAGIDLFAKISEIYNISADWLLTGRGEVFKGANNNALNNTISNGNFQQGKHINDVKCFSSVVSNIQKDYQKIIEAKDEQIKLLIGIIEKK